MNAISSWLQSYWRWASGGSKRRLVAGVGGPVLAGLVVLSAAFGSSEKPGAEQGQPVPTTESQPGAANDTQPSSPSASSQAALPPTEGPAIPTAPVPELTPLPESYVIQPGDSLTVICASQAPHLQTDSCILQVVQLNNLVDASQIAAGQVLLLPIGSSTAQEPPPPVAPTEAPIPPTTTPVTSPTPSSGRTTALVVRVIDGDTIEVEGGARVRYIGIDTPEVGGDCYSQEATSRNEALVLGRVVELEKDLSETDQYDRLLRYVYVDGVMVNEVLVAEGFAQVSTYPPDVRYVDVFLAAQRQAVENGRGLWSGCAAPTVSPVLIVPTAVPVAPIAPTAHLQQGNCHPSYPTVCIPPSPPDLDCPDIPYRRFQVTGSDPHRFDGDHDGVGCES